MAATPDYFAQPQQQQQQQQQQQEPQLQQLERRRMQSAPLAKGAASAPPPSSGAVGAKAATAPAPEKMREVIMKQKASGSWEWEDALVLVGLTADKLRAGLPSARLKTGA
jgi:transcription initiation factor TFIID subunit TAF12